MSDDEENRRENQPSKQGKKQTLAGATHLLKAEALKRLELKDAEEPSSTEKQEQNGVGEGVGSRPISDQEGSKRPESGKGLEADSRNKKVEIAEEEQAGINRPQSGEGEFRGLSKDVNNLSAAEAKTSDLGNEDPTAATEELRPSVDSGKENKDSEITKKLDGIGKEAQDSETGEKLAELEEKPTEKSADIGSKEPVDDIKPVSESKSETETKGELENKQGITEKGAAEFKEDITLGELTREEKEERSAAESQDTKTANGDISKDNELDNKLSSEEKNKSAIEKSDTQQSVPISKMDSKSDGKEGLTGDRSEENQGGLAEGNDSKDKGMNEGKKDDIGEESVEGTKEELTGQEILKEGSKDTDGSSADVVSVEERESKKDKTSDTEKILEVDSTGEKHLQAKTKDATVLGGTGDSGEMSSEPEANQEAESSPIDNIDSVEKTEGSDSVQKDSKAEIAVAEEDSEAKTNTDSTDQSQVIRAEKDDVDDSKNETVSKQDTAAVDDAGSNAGGGRDNTQSEGNGGGIGEAQDRGIKGSGEEAAGESSKENEQQGISSGNEKDGQEGEKESKVDADESNSAQANKVTSIEDTSASGGASEDRKGDENKTTKPDETPERKPVNVIKNIEISNEPEVKGEGIKLKKEPKAEKNKGLQKEKSSDEEGADETEKEDSTSLDNVQDDEGGEMLFEPEEHTMPADFYYDHEEHVSKPFTTDGIPENMLSLYHSFGFECTKRSNLHMLDEENMLFSAGNMVQILNISTNKLTYIRSIGGGGIGAIAIHPSRKYFAVAEKGVKPNIVIYEYPSLKLYRILRDGTELAYANLDFSPNGEKLASVGSAPDYMLTVWDWKNENIVLRTKAFSQEVYKIAFSPEDEGHLCSSGTAHIRFWKMANTFTGLKLQGELGRFGTTELSDIAGFVELPDGKVLSGSEWGNMLLWDGGLIKVEIARKGKKTCHVGMIEQFFLDEGELITIGDDGFVKVWDFESIDTADAVDESKIFEMEPMSELKVGSDVKLMSMVKSVNSSEASIWYAQDAAGGIWKLDLSFSHTSQAPKKLFTYHAGAISGLAISPMTHLSATTGSDNTVRLYDYLAKTQLCHSKFTAAGSCIIWMPKVVDADGLSILAGFADGVVRLFTVVKNGKNTLATKKNASNFDLKLSQVFKPHTKPVTSLAVSKDGRFLATGGDDSTVFFFSIDKMKCKAIGFIETGAPVVSLDWSSVQRKNHLLISCNDCSVLEVSCPKPDKYDTSKTYLIPLPGLKRKEFKFLSIKDKLVKAEEDLRKAKEEEERQKQLEEERKKRKARGIEDEEEENKEEEDVEKSEVAPSEEEEEITHEPGKIVKGFYKGESGEFWLLLDGWDAGYIYQCAFPSEKENNVDTEPLRAIKFDDIDDVPVMSHYFSKSGQYLALGLENGAIRIQVLESHDLNTLSSYWRLNMHDNQSGAIMGISMSFDEKFLLSVGKDGNFFVYSFMDEKKVMEMIGKQRAEVAAKQADSSTLLKIDDIEDPNHYSIELEKQKAEHDKMMRLAEEKKQQIRQTINLLRIEFKKLAARNQEMPPYLQLPPSDFIIDPEMESDIAKETERKLGLLQREMAWESEKYSLALKKLQTRFKDMIECERFTVRAFNTTHKVFSYRATALPPEFNETLEETKHRTKTAENETMPLIGGKRLSFMAKKVRALSKDESSSEDVTEAIQPKKAKPAQNLDEKIAKAIEKAEQKKKRRQARQAEWDEFYRSKPDQNKEDPLDLAAIKEAQDNMGDFKLKTAKDYIVPEKQRVNAETKRVQLMELKEHIHQLKQSFNEKLLALRSNKIACIDTVKTLTSELEEVQNGLPSSMHVAAPPIPLMHVDEQPEKLYEYTKDGLLKFKEKKEEESNQHLKSENTGTAFGGGFGGFGSGEQSQPNPSKLTSQLASTRTEQRGRSTSILSTLSSHPRSGSSLPPDRGTPDTIREEQMINLEPSDMELKVRDERRLRLVYKRDMLLRKIREVLIAFDAELRTLRHEKIHLDVDLKNADLRIITLFEEFVLLKEFEKRENILMGKVVTKSQEKEDMQDKVEDCQMKLQAQKEEIDRLQERDKALYTTFASTVGDSNKFEAFLMKVFKKKIKRVKKTEQNAGSDEESDDDFSDDDYDSEEDEDSETEELDDSVCPPGCDQAIFDQVCQLREKRLDLEEATVEEKKTADALKKELDALQKKAKIIDTGLMTAEAELEAFQREKQQKLNELDVVVTLKLSQLQYLNNSTVPQDLSQSLVFTSSSLERLQRRIKELEKEKAEQKKLYWQRRQQHVQLIRDKKSMETKIAQLEEKVKQMQLLKFGRLVNLEKLETVSVNKLAEEIKEQLRTQEFASAKEIASWEKRIDEAKAKLTQVTRENTRRLDTYTVLLQEKKELEGQLDSKQKNLGGEFQGNRKADYQERQRLIQLAQLQSQEIEALKEEIGLLSRKGGHILPPSQAPVPQAPAAR